MKFKRNTHDEDGNVRDGLPRIDHKYVRSWPTCNIHILTGEMTVRQIYDEHKAYDSLYEPEVHGYSVADILNGLADLLRLGLVEIVEW